MDFKPFLPLLISVMSQAKPALSKYLFNTFFFAVNYVFRTFKTRKMLKTKASVMLLKIM